MNTEYKCKHCSKEKGKHKAVTYHCPKTNKYNKYFPQWLTSVYEPNYDKPLPKPKYTL